MDKLLRRLFDYQQFAQSPKLDALLRDVESKYPPRSLSDDELEGVAAAGDPYANAKLPNKDGPV